MIMIPLAYICGHNFSEVILFLESNVTKIFEWFHENGLIANSIKNHFLISPYETKSIKMQNLCIKASFSEEVPGTKIDSNLTFHEHITSLCSKANEKLNLLSRVLKYMGIKKMAYINEIIYFPTICLLFLSLDVL